MGQVKSTMAGTVFKILVQAGEVVDAGREVVVLESMKMEIPIIAEREAKVKEVGVSVGDFINEGDVLLELE
ncbi:acetyl-CoA carboxylase biotin carboxyl carrier protein subunit [Cytobacillus purgationiresistens]|uniref:Acetyl-CoA carboxylase biotin carboxyl carrier protein n=1 Tax=Cytobacillus purgationiresistens TaxID=863449 RepID=A0ABU0AN90_9BACI|nr:acetyl-CoA carboxylase biotin carboxyl carrier protein subunit [Cytobacillus purgationiresistens]MDQ0272648.1 acetyl-CoA carboxylase biotin carboxyl carrier protein [Cytobacillus purgationiresistens]